MSLKARTWFYFGFCLVLIKNDRVPAADRSEASLQLLNDSKLRGSLIFNK